MDSRYQRFLDNNCTQERIVKWGTAVYIAGNVAGEFLGSEILNLHNTTSYLVVTLGVGVSCLIHKGNRVMEGKLVEKTKSSK